MKRLKELLRVLLDGVASLFQLRASCDYPELSSHPFADDRARLRSDFRKVQKVMSDAARDKIKTLN